MLWSKTAIRFLLRLVFAQYLLHDIRIGCLGSLPQGHTRQLLFAHERNVVVLSECFKVDNHLFETMQTEWQVYNTRTLGQNGSCIDQSFPKKRG